MLNSLVQFCNQAVIGFVYQQKIFWPVVVLLAIYVMHVFVTSQRPAEFASHDKPMFQHLARIECHTVEGVFASNVNANVALACPGSPALPSFVSRPTAAFSRTQSTSPVAPAAQTVDGANTAPKNPALFSAISANDLDGVLLVYWVDFHGVPVDDGFLANLYGWFFCDFFLDSAVQPNSSAGVVALFAVPVKRFVLNAVNEARSHLPLFFLAPLANNADHEASGAVTRHPMLHLRPIDSASIKLFDRRPCCENVIAC